ncbi:glycosyltransferase family A protein [Methylobacterium segetis]|uniref:glycosyltransferase family A protein n=1 Tax=Methylobacterium segetis TaxID=2488750 RepID=UPI00104F8489|nr:glycosyltransferase family A protein [Methylobacterium segetis]
MAEPFTFGIPLIAREAAADWPLVTALLGLTLASAAAQTDRSFRIVIAAHDEPPLPCLADRTTILAADWAAADVRADNLDSGRKKHAIARHVLAQGGGLLMFLDADDWIDRHLVEIARATIPPDALGGYIAEGFAADVRSLRATPLPDPEIFDGAFHRLCGSSIVARLIPDSADPLRRDPHAALHEHYRWPETAHERGAKVVRLRATGAYVINTSANHSETHGPYSAWRRDMSARVGRTGFPFDEAFLSRFGLTPDQVGGLLRRGSGEA